MHTEYGSELLHGLQSYRHGRATLMLNAFHPCTLSHGYFFFPVLMYCPLMFWKL